MLLVVSLEDDDDDDDDDNNNVANVSTSIGCDPLAIRLWFNSCVSQWEKMDFVGH